MFTPMNTRDDSTGFLKTLLYAAPGWGKTTQAKHYTNRYGKGFIISGEAGLSSIRSSGIDYLPFSSFDGETIPDKGIYSFSAICRAMLSDDFKSMGYKWIMLDSLTELSDMVYSWADAKATATAVAANKKVNGFDIWGEYKDQMIKACKFIRNLPYQIVLTALAKNSEDDNGDELKLPLLQGSAIQAQVPGIFDNVFGAYTKSVKDSAGVVVTKRYVVTGTYTGWQGKVRDESGLISLVEETGDITTILDKISGGAKKP